ncbi:MAG: hypothetical protein E7314_05720 [Clostridiales bacterium]|nr:hypothetical protein [Clostridiales bacterium]
MYILIICTILSSSLLFFACHKKSNVEEVIHDEEISPILKNIGDNEVIAKEILGNLNNTHTGVEKNKDEKIKASFYNCNTDKIVIKDTKDLEDLSRVVHIAHECVHSLQDKKLQKIHFFISNIQILYFLAIFIYFFYNKNIELRFTLLLVQVFIFFITFFIKVVLESDATYRAVLVSLEYLHDKLNPKQLKIFKQIVEDNLYKLVPMSYFGLFVQGVILLIIAQVGAVLT